MRETITEGMVDGSAVWSEVKVQFWAGHADEGAFRSRVGCRRARILLRAVGSAWSQSTTGRVLLQSGQRPGVGGGVASAEGFGVARCGGCGGCGGCGADAADAADGCAAGAGAPAAGAVGLSPSSTAATARAMPSAPARSQPGPEPPAAAMKRLLRYLGKTLRSCSG